MQTFLPFPSFARSARALDRPRLGKQRVECVQLLRALTGETEGYRRHPAALMWEEYEQALGLYAIAVCGEWTSRGYRDNCAAQVRELITVPEGITLPQMKADGNLPWWFGSRRFHRAHQSNLLRKNPARYDTIFPGVPDDLPYAWPQSEPGVFRYKHAGLPWIN